MGRHLLLIGATATLAVGACASDGDDPVGLVESSLDRIPAMPWTDAGPDDPRAGSGFGVAAIDISRAADDLGLDAPADTEDPTAALELFVELGLEDPVADGGIGAVPLVTEVFDPTFLEFPRLRSFADAAEVEAVIGFSPLSIRTAVSAGDGRHEFVVLTGDLPLASTLFERSDGVVSLADDPTGDPEFVDRPTAVSSLVNINFAHLDSSDPTSPLGLSTDADLVETWLDGGETLLALPGVRDVARELDRAGVSSAFVAGDLPDDPSSFDAGRLSVDFDGADTTSEPFSVFGYGVSVGADGCALVTAAYQFADDESAERARTELEAAWTGDVRFGDELFAAADRWMVRSTERSGSTVVVTAAPNDDLTTKEITDVLPQSSLRFFAAE